MSSQGYKYIFFLTLWGHLISPRKEIGYFLNFSKRAKNVSFSLPRLRLGSGLLLISCIHYVNGRCPRISRRERVCSCRKKKSTTFVIVYDQLRLNLWSGIGLILRNLPCSFPSVSFRYRQYVNHSFNLIRISSL